MFWSPEKFLMDPQQLNSYSYARNNPIIYQDPGGEFVQILVATAGGAILGGVIGGTIAALNGGDFWDGAKYGAIAGATAGLVVSTAGLAAPALGLTSAEAIIGGSAVGNALGGVAARTSVGQKTTAGDVGLDLVVGGAGGMLGVGYLRYKGNIGANGNYIPSMAAKNLPQDASTLLREYKGNGWQKATSGPTGQPHPWSNIKGLIKGALPDKGTIFDAQYSQGSARGAERFVRIGDKTYYSNTHYGENPVGSIPFYKITN